MRTLAEQLENNEIARNVTVLDKSCNLLISQLATYKPNSLISVCQSIQDDKAHFENIVTDLHDKLNLTYHWGQAYLKSQSNSDNVIFSQELSAFKGLGSVVKENCSE